MCLSEATNGLMEVYTNKTLTENHYGTIVIMANNITLNLNYKSVFGNGTTEHTGITIDNKSRVTVKNGHIQNYTLAHVHIKPGCSNITIDNVTTYLGSGVGFRVEQAYRVKLIECNASRCGQEGFQLRDQTNMYLYDCYSVYGGRDGFDENRGRFSFYSYAGAVFNTVNGIETDETIYFYYYDCNSRYNGQHGLSISDNSTRGVAMRNFLYRNSRDGLHIRTGSTNNYFEDCTGLYNGDENLDDDVGGNTYYNCNFP